jgi:hypothetical protein
LVGYLPYSSDVHNGILVGYNKTSANITNAYVSSSCSTSNGYATNDGSSNGTTAILADLVSASSATTGTFLDNALAFSADGLLQKNAPAYLADLLACDTCSEYDEAPLSAAPITPIVRLLRSSTARPTLTMLVATPPPLIRPQTNSFIWKA